MTTSPNVANNNIWDRLKSCVLGSAWGPEFYDWIPSVTARTAFEKIAVETNEDLNNLKTCLEKLGVQVLRPTLPRSLNRTLMPPISPRDHMCMLGNTLYDIYNFSELYYKDIFKFVERQGCNVVKSNNTTLCGSMLYQFADQIVFSTWDKTQKNTTGDLLARKTGKPANWYYLPGHIDGWFCPVTPGLIVSSSEEHRPELLDLFYKTYFPDYEVVYLGPTFENTYSASQWSNQKWYVPGEETNLDFINSVNTYFVDWVGNMSETVFEANMIVVDKNNVIVSQYNQELFKKFEQYNVTPHVCELRHKMFWDSGVNCAIADLERG